MSDPRVLVTGWPSVLHGEATAGDVLALRTVDRALDRAGIPHDTAWSAVMRPPGGLALDEAVPERYSHLVFVCGPATGIPVTELHDRFAHCTRIAVGVSVIDPADPAVRGFHRIIARENPPDPPRPDLAVAAPMPTGARLPPVLGVFLTGGQREYGSRRRHDAVNGTVQHWLTGLPAARLDLDTRLDPRDWRLPGTPEQLQSVIERLDAVVTLRMHGLVLALRAGVPALALDPVDGGGKVTAQARALGWPAVLPAEAVSGGGLDRQLQWCLAEGRALARRHAARDSGRNAEQDTDRATATSLVSAQMDELVRSLRGE